MLPTTHHHPSTTTTKAAPAQAAIVKKAADGAVVAGGDYLKRGKENQLEAEAAVLGDAAVDVCLAAAAMAGAALLAWWAVAFHPSYAQLWMVPLGLVLAGTPPIVCLALRFSGGTAGKGGGSASAAAPPPLAAVVVHK